jgi:6-pyruvoyltetrahydropterin/6-carboxytetrahydropterin synthase
MSLILERRYRFSAAHRYFRPEWSECENRRRFGKCAIAPGHGHNYRLIVEVGGPLDAQTGFVIDLAQLDEVVERLVIEPLDHRHLNEAVPEFAAGRAIPSSENLVLWIRDRLLAALPPATTLRALKLAEDDDLAAIWRQDENQP